MGLLDAGIVRTFAQRRGGDPATKATDASWPTQSEKFAAGLLDRS